MAVATAERVRRKRGADKPPADHVGTGRSMRRLREGMGLTQVEMARRLTISASYLNLIEHGERPLTARLLLRLGEEFDVDHAAFSESEGARVAADLVEAFADPLFGGRGLSESEVRDVVGTSPDVARAVLDLYRAFRGAREQADNLGEQLRGRELLAGTNYEFRNLVASIRSCAEILRDNPELDLEQRRRFVEILVEDSKRLMPLFAGLLDVDVGGSVAVSEDRRPAGEDIADFLQARSGYLEELERAADGLRGAAGIDATVAYERLAEFLTREHRIIPRIVPAEAGRAVVADAPADSRLELPEAHSHQTRVLAVTKVAALLRCRETIERCVDELRWTSPESRDLAVSALGDYVAEAVLMPYDEFLLAARGFRYDVERLQRRFGVGFEQVCRRLTSLQRPGAKGVPFHIVKVDMAGNVTWRLGRAGMRVPRYGGVCPLWNVHAAFLTPGVTRAQLSRMPDGTSYFSIARAIPSEEPEKLRSPRFSAVELGCDLSFARDIVYADGLELGGAAVAVPIGTTCRLCERLDCSQRVLPPLRQPAKMAARKPDAAVG
jgi:predicted transcriptional regulator/transcriptional regulator with XRE-family HTH domain